MVRIGDSCRWMMGLAAVSICCFAPAALAEPEAGGETIPRAADLRIAADRFDEGRDAFKAGAFAEAAEHFEAADARAPSASALSLAMRSSAEAGQYGKALSLAELLITRHPDNAEAVGLARQLIARHSGALGLIEVSCQTSCEIVLDRRLVHGAASSTWRVYVEAGTHSVTATFQDNRYAEGIATVGVGQRATLALSPPPEVAATVAPRGERLANPEGTPPRGSRGWSPIWFWTAAGATVVVGGLTVWSGIDTLTNPGVEEVRDSCAGQGTDCDLYQKGQAKELRTNLLLGGTALLAVATTAIGVFATDFRSSPVPARRGNSRVQLRLVASAGMGQGALIGAEGRF